MKKITQTTLLAITLSTTSGIVAAEGGQAYAGLKLGSFMVDASGLDDATPFGIQLGYDLGERFSFEFEYNAGSSDSQISGTSVDITTMAIYGTFRSEGRAYFLAKAGLIKEEIDTSVVTVDDTGMSYGFGGGFKLSDNIALEAEYTIIEEDISYVGATARVLF